VIGIASFPQGSSPDPLAAQLDAVISDMFPERKGLWPLRGVRRVLAFEEGDNQTQSDDQNQNTAPPPPSVSVIPSFMNNKKLYIGTLVADLCSQILTSFGTVVRCVHSDGFMILTTDLVSGSIPRESCG
jgi:hypothetical protein